VKEQVLLDPFGSFALFQVLFVIMFIAVIVVMIVRALALRKGEVEGASAKSEVIREKEVIREIVKVRCRYCGQLYEEKLDKCPHCGGKNV